MQVATSMESLRRSLSVETYTTLEAVKALAPQWRRLHEQCGSELPFDTPDWTLCWWPRFGEAKAAIEDRLALKAVRRPDGTLVAVAPLMVTTRPAIGPFRVRVVQFIGADPNITEIRGLLCLKEFEDEVVAALLADLEGRASEWDFMFWHAVREDSPTDLRLGTNPAEARTRWLAEVPAYVLELKPTWDEFRAGLSRNIKESLRKTTNAPRRDGLELQTEVVQGRAPVLGAVDLLLRLHRMRAEADLGVRHANVFEAPQARAFLREVSAALVERDQAVVFLVKISGVPVAARLGFRCGNSLYLYYSGFDPAFAKYSVATTAVAAALRWATEQGFATVSLSPGRDQSKVRWGPREIRKRTALLLSPGRRAAIAYEAYRRLGDAARASPLRELLARRQSTPRVVRVAPGWRTALGMAQGWFTARDRPEAGGRARIAGDEG